MKREKRCEMKRGTIFGLVAESWLASCGQPEAYVVIDAKTEVGFWSGARTCVGEVAPSLWFEVLT